MTKLIITILCGGAGARLWPISREHHPKPFIRLADKQSLLQKAFLRGVKLANATEVITVTNRELLFKAKAEYAEVNLGGLPTSYVLEPFGRNTAPALAIAALQAQKKYGDGAIMLALAADHLITNQDAFQSAVTEAITLAQAGKIVTFGITPTSHETGYGYIEANGNTVIQFVEKPSLTVARSYVASGNYLWNSGMFCFEVGSMLSEMRQHCPALLDAVEVCVANTLAPEQVDLPASLFVNVPDISIDYAVMEKTSQAAVVPCDIGWSDIGSWDALGSLHTADANGNTVMDGVGNVIDEEGTRNTATTLLHDTTNTYIQSQHRVVGVVGVNNLVIIDTPDALLVADRSHAQDVRHIYAKLKADDHEVHKIHRTVYRPWGTYTVLDDGNNYKMKRIEVKPGGSLSLQMHHHRSEHWIVVEGRANVINGDLNLVLNTNESTYIPAGKKHRLQNTTNSNLVLIEVQCGTYLGEDDIVRFDDLYGRVAAPVTPTEPS